MTLFTLDKIKKFLTLKRIMKTIDEIKSITETKKKAQIPDVEKQIEAEALKGLSFVIWEKELFEDTIKHLQRKGYEVFEKEDVFGDDIYKITWNL